jgi:hypothetical protein
VVEEVGEFAAEVVEGVVFPGEKEFGLGAELGGQVSAELLAEAGDGYGVVLV